MRADNRTQHLTHSRLVVVRETVITEAAGVVTLPSRRDEAIGRVGVRDLRAPDAPLHIFDVEDCPHVTAIAALPGNQGFVTGGERGEIDSWSWHDGWRQCRWRAPTGAKERLPGIVWASYRPESIVGIVSLAGSHEVVAVTAGGELVILREGREFECHRLAPRGTPRSLAAHPHKPWLAVGIKQGGFTRPQSVVTIVAVES